MLGRLDCIRVLVAATMIADSHCGCVLTGGGNVATNAQVDSGVVTQMSILNTLGANALRSNLYPGTYISGTNWSFPTPTRLDPLLQAALQANLTIQLLFEFYAQYAQQMGFGDFNAWYGIGSSFASYAMPGGTWGSAHGAPPSWGITTYSAFNEPDDGGGNYSFLQGGNPGPGAYAAALSGLAQGIKSVCPACEVMPGGYMSMNAFDDATLRGLGKVVAPLWNNGTLDGIDLHTYYDVQYAPMEGTFSHSSQSNMDAIVQANGITAQRLMFHSTEYNYKTRLVNDTAAARGLLTAFWDSMSIQHGGVPVTTLSFPWNIFDTTAGDAPYGMALQDEPYVPSPKGLTYALALALLASSGSPIGWSWASSDPHGTGVSVLLPAGSMGLGNSTLCARETVSLCAQQGPRSLAVWQARPSWSTLYGTASFPIPAAALVPGVTTLDVYGWDGLRASLTLATANGTLPASLMPGNETYMLFSHDGSCGIWAGLQQ